MKAQILSKKIITAGLFALTVVPLVFTYWTSNYHILKVVVSQGIILTIFIFWQIGQTKQKISINSSNSSDNLPPLTINFAILTYLFICSASLIKSTTIFESLKVFSQLFNYTLLFFIISHCLKSDQRIKQIITAMVIVGSLVSLYGLMQIVGIDNPLYQPPPPGSSTLGNVNFAAGFIIIVIPLTISLMLIARNFYKKGLFCLSGLLMFIHLYYTHCRGAWLAISAALLAMTLCLLRGKRLKIAIIITVGLLSIVLVFLAVSHTNIIDLAYYFDPFRCLVWRSTLTMIARRPFLGVGLGNFFLNYPLYRRDEEWQLSGLDIQTLHTHNDYLEISAETGLLGLAAFLFILVAFVFLFRSIKINAPDRATLFFATGIFAGILATLVQCIFSFDLTIPSSALYFWYLLGMLATLRGKLQYPPGNTNSPFRASGTSCPQAEYRPKSLFNSFLHHKVFQPGRGFKNPATWIISIVLAIMFVYTGLLPLIADIYFQRARVYQHRQKYEKALIMCQKATQVYYPYIDPHFMKGRLHQKLNQYTDALNEMEITLSLHPNFPWAYQALGEIYVQQGRLNKGAKYFQKAAGFHPWYNNYLARILIQENNLDKALSLISKAMLTGYKPEVTWKTLGLFYEKTNKPDMARQAYNRALVIDSQHFPDYLKMAELTSQQEDYENSIPYYRQAVRLRPDNEKAHLGLMIAYLETGDFEQAVNQGKILVNLRPNLWNAHAILALAYEGLKDYPAAQKEWQKVLELEPDNPRAKRHLLNLNQLE